MVRRFRCRERTGSPRIELTQLLLLLFLLPLKDQLYRDLARCEKKIHVLLYNRLLYPTGFIKNN